MVLVHNCRNYRFAFILVRGVSLFQRTAGVLSYICWHQQTLDAYCNAICECLIHSAKDCIPVQRKCVAGWNDSASFLKQQASFWHQIWTECGSPSVGVVAQMSKITLQG